MAGLDYLESKWREEPQSIAYIIVYGGRRGAKRRDTETRMGCIKDYKRSRVQIIKNCKIEPPR